MAFVPAVPEAAAGGVTIGEVVIALAAMLGWAICFGLLFAWNYTTGFLLDKLGDVLDFHVLHVHVDLGGPVRDLNNSVRSALSAGVSTFDHAMGLFFHWAAVMLAWMVNFAAASAQDTLRFAEWLTGAHLPKWVKGLIYATFPPALIARLVKAAIDAQLPHIGRPLIERITLKPITKVYKYAAAIALPGYIGLPKIHRDLTNLWKWRTKAEHRLRKVEKYAAAGVFAGLLANALGVTTKCVRSGNVGKAARAICGLDAGLFAALLAGLAIIEYPLSIDELAHEYLSVFDDVLGLVKKGVTEIEAL